MAARPNFRTLSVSTTRGTMVSFALEGSDYRFLLKSIKTVRARFVVFANFDEILYTVTD